MDLLNNIQAGLSQALGLQPIFLMVAGTVLGMIVGATPGLSSGMAVAVLLPVTFGMSPLNGLIFLTSVYVAVTYGGSVTAILLNTPGAPENAATCLDGYPLTQQGRSAEAMGTAISSSAVGGILSYVIMLVGIGAVASIALKFGPSEIFLIAIAGVAILGAVGNGSPLKILASGTFGLLVGTIGIVPTGEWRATFGDPFLAEGVQVVPVLIGVFVVSELMQMAGRDYIVDAQVKGQQSLTNILRAFTAPVRHLATVLRSSAVGMGIGLIPAAGATLAAFASYSLTRRLSKDPDSFGKGNVSGIVAAESGNNACSGGALMTTLVLGVPGSVATAVLLGALTMHGLQAGPQLVYQQIPLVYGLIMAAIISQIFMVTIAIGVGYGLSGALSVPTRILIPLLMLFSLLGAFALRNAVFDVNLMLLFGAFGYVMKSHGYSPAAVVMGVILASIADNEMIRMFQLFGGDWYLEFFMRPISLGILVLLVGGLTHRLWYRRGQPSRFDMVDE
ncbi:tripartite tricarboxylate transporter permease [Shumkonia mesophila]|uniref:tripartite tricarboxylate transporter permease n=1 Tax=Shumkonia mesophila TaxID=2838854 RepID=UPI0029352CB3|nr:tripartite tricarboxylate transporter permease [Shumkonia mesophila]